MSRCVCVCVTTNYKNFLNYHTSLLLLFFLFPQRTGPICCGKLCNLTNHGLITAKPLSMSASVKSKTATFLLWVKKNWVANGCLPAWWWSHLWPGIKSHVDNHLLSLPPNAERERLICHVNSTLWMNFLSFGHLKFVLLPEVGMSGSDKQLERELHVPEKMWKWEWKMIAENIYWVGRWSREHRGYKNK